MNWYGGIVERLCICVAEYEGHFMDSFTVHVVHGVSTAATDTDDLDNAVGNIGIIEIQYVYFVLVVCHNRIVSIIMCYQYFRCR